MDEQEKRLAALRRKNQELRDQVLAEQAQKPVEQRLRDLEEATIENRQTLEILKVAALRVDSLEERFDLIQRGFELQSRNVSALTAWFRKIQAQAQREAKRALGETSGPEEPGRPN